MTSPPPTGHHRRSACWSRHRSAGAEAESGRIRKLRSVADGTTYASRMRIRPRCRWWTSPWRGSLTSQGRRAEAWA
jgi:hypothetical protein